MRITCYVDADHATDVVTRRSVTGIIIFLNNMPIRFLSKRQKCCATSTYGAELIAARQATEMILELRYFLRSLGVPIDGPALLLGDNESVVVNTTTPSSLLKKKHLGVSYHMVREAIAMGAMEFCYVNTKENLADCLTKSLSPAVFKPLVESVLARKHFDESFGSTSTIIRNRGNPA